MDILFLITGLIVGFIIAFFMSKSKLSSIEKQSVESLSNIDKERLILQEKFNLITEQKNFIEKNLENERQETKRLNDRISRAEEIFKNQEEKLKTQKQEIEDLYLKLNTEFENLANKILKQNTQEFTATNQKNIGEILNPLKEKIEKFEKKVDDIQKEDIRERTSLLVEVKKLSELHTRISEEANNLTKALKGDNKKQGNWGEIILERVLERSGLSKGVEYDTQRREKSDDGEIFIPDVVINLPDNKHIIVDSKVSLVAYQAYVNSEIQEEKDKFLKQHIDSLKAHVKGLSEKNYQNIKEFNTPDFVLMFLPIESSFGIAIQTENELFNFAWEMRIVIVSPTTLLATLRTIASIWKQENQTKNALEIARQSGALYDKFVLMLKDVENIGSYIAKSNEAYNETIKKISTGSGNIVGRIENIRKLGAKATKTIPEKYIGNENISIDIDEKN